MCFKFKPKPAGNECSISAPIDHGENFIEAAVRFCATGILRILDGDLGSHRLTAELHDNVVGKIIQRHAFSLFLTGRQTRFDLRGNDFDDVDLSFQGFTQGHRIAVDRSFRRSVGWRDDKRNEGEAGGYIDDRSFWLRQKVIDQAFVRRIGPRRFVVTVAFASRKRLTDARPAARDENAVVLDFMR